MPKVITMTYLLKNPAKVRAYIKLGKTLLVTYKNEIVMEIRPVKEENIALNTDKKPI